ncbi:MAG: DUF6445 family protein [Aestuariibacter sp.]
MQFNQQCTVHITYLGDEQVPLFIIDDLVLEPETLVDYAEQHGAFGKQKDDFYPGLRSALPSDYVSAVIMGLQSIIAQHMTLDHKGVNPVFSAYSLTTEKAESLAPIQCIPHFDTTDANQLAFVHYLFDKDFGGTSFYRHNKTGYTAIDQQNCNNYMATLKTQATTVGLPEKQYILGDTELFSLEHRVAAKFNRALLYPSNVLHSGDIDSACELSAQPRKGRLTANLALQMMPG